MTCEQVTVSTMSSVVARGLCRGWTSSGCFGTHPAPAVDNAFDWMVVTGKCAPGSFASCLVPKLTGRRHCILRTLGETPEDLKYAHRKEPWTRPLWVMSQHFTCAPTGSRGDPSATGLLYDTSTPASGSQGGVTTRLPAGAAEGLVVAFSHRALWLSGFCACDRHCVVLQAAPQGGAPSARLPQDIRSWCR